jgi:DNA polymerase
MTQFDPSDQALTREDALQRLIFCVEAGVTDIFSDEVQNRYQLEQDAPQSAAVTSAAKPAPRRAAPSALREGPPPAFQAPVVQTIATDDAEAINRAREIAARAATLDELRAAVAGFDGCSLRNTAKNLVFADGDPQARVMFVGEAPGSDDDLDGLPFAGPAGQLLERMLAAIGLSRQTVCLTHLLPWRPPGNRQPTPEELAICRPFITRQIELCDPALLVCLGGVAAKELLGVDTPFLRLRGQWKPYKGAGGEIAALTTLAPDYLLKHPASKRLAWRDLLALKGRLG